MRVPQEAAFFESKVVGPTGGAVGGRCAKLLRHSAWRDTRDREGVTKKCKKVKGTTWRCAENGAVDAKWSRDTPFK